MHTDLSTTPLPFPCQSAHAQSIQRGDLDEDGEAAHWARRHTLRPGPRAGTVDAPAFLAPKACAFCALTNSVRVCYTCQKLTNIQPKIIVAHGSEGNVM